MHNTVGEQILASLMRLGVVKLEGSTYIGRASDGVWVQLGTLGEEKTHMGRYLATHPTPEHW